VSVNVSMRCAMVGRWVSACCDRCEAWAEGATKEQPTGQGGKGGRMGDLASNLSWRGREEGWVESGPAGRLCGACGPRTSVRVEVEANEFLEPGGMVKN
jgi:hypothetical protein